MVFRHCLALMITLAVWQAGLSSAKGQNYERYKPLDVPLVDQATPEIPSQDKELKEVEDDRVLVKSLDAVIIVDHADKVSKDESIDDLEGIQYDFACSHSLVFKSGIRSIVSAELGKPITLRRINQMTRDIIKQYRDCKQPFVDVQVPEQRITGGTLQLIITESRIEDVRLKPGHYFDFDEVSRWIKSTRAGNKIHEQNIENDLLWLNQNSFRQVSVDFEKGDAAGTTDVIYSVKDQFPLRVYSGIDDSGVASLNYGRFFAGFQYGNVLGKGGTFGYQYTADESFSLLEAHSVNFTQPINRDYSLLTFASWAGVSPELGLGLNQEGESYQFGSLLTRHLVRTAKHVRNATIGYDFKATNNNLEFAGTTISDSVADLFQIRFGLEDVLRQDVDQYESLRFDTFIGPGGGLTSHHSADAFGTLRPGTSPDYIYAKLQYERADLVRESWLLSSRITGQASSERLLFSETIGLGGFDSIRGTDQRAFSADHGWIANFELGPKPYRWGCEHDPRTLRAYTFVDMGNGYLDDPAAGEDASTFAISTGIGARFQLSNRVIARFDYGVGIEDIDNANRTDRAHFGLTYIPSLNGRR